MSRPLEGVRVADFSRVLAGPLCSQMLADAGADVVKIEEPRFGDETRRWGPPFVNGVSTYFLGVNRGKRSLALDLTRGSDITRKLIRWADVVIDNFLPQQRERLGLHRVRKINPRAIHCMIAGYDSDTPDRETPGYDLLAQAESGLMAITGEPDGDPMKCGVAISDVLTAHYAFGAIGSALFARERSGRGASIEVSLFGVSLASLVNVGQSALITGVTPRRHGNEHPSIVPYQIFRASDRSFALGAGTDRHFQALCNEVVGQPALATDVRFLTNAARVDHRSTLIPLLEAIFEGKRARVWIGRCRKASVPAALVQGVGEALATEAALPLIGSIDDPVAGRYDAIRNPVRIDGKRAPLGRAPSTLGGDTEPLLLELGVTPSSIAKLREAGLIGPQRTSAAGRRSR